ncbi:MAG: ANTAR domain-containing response regulator [Lachnospiraceae bacterium]
MTNVIVAFSRPEDGRSIKSILIRNGFQVSALCTSGAQVLNSADALGSGIIVCGYRFADMMFDELHSCLPPRFDMLLVSSPTHWSSHMPKDLICLAMPLKVHALVETMEMMDQAQRRRKKRQRWEHRERSQEDQRLIDEAKLLLMDRNHLSETEAHRYLQRCSMDSGTNLVETAQMVISLVSI